MTNSTETDKITDELLFELKTLASKATPGEWWCDSHGNSVSSHAGDEVLNVFTSVNYLEKAVRHPTGNLSYWRNDWDASYIPTACPKNILKLINRLEEAESKLKEHNLM